MDEELERLPDQNRAAFVLCCLEGLTGAEAARELGCPVGTIDSRLHAARARLRDRLIRRGFGPGALAGLLVVAAPPATTLAAAVGAVAGVAPRPAAALLATQVSRIMTPGTTTLKIFVGIVLAVAFAGAVWALDGPTAAPSAGPVGLPHFGSLDSLKNL